MARSLFQWLWQGLDTWLTEIEASMPESVAAQRRARRQAIEVLILSAFCLLALNYLKFADVFWQALAWLSDVFGGDAAALRSQLQSGFGELAGHAWWGLWHLLMFLLVPLLYARYRLGLRASQLGLGRGTTLRHWPWYLLLMAPICGFAVMASFRPDFASHYPFYSLAGRSWTDLLLWELLYIGQFVCLEFFFRGFLLQTLRPAFGAGAIAVMCLPYLMIHFPKPWLEATGAIGFGLALGLLAMRSGSIWGGVAVHAGVALSMDLAALMQSGGLPR